MSRWTVLAIERLGAPSILWPSPFGPAVLTPGTDPMSLSAATQNGCRTMDLSVNMLPFQIKMQLEKDFGKVHLGTIRFDYNDADGSAAAALAPGSSTLGTATRYFSPWIMVQEVGAATTTIFLGYIDQNSIEWDEENRITTFDAFHAMQLLQDRLASEVGLVRALPAGPTGAASSFLASTADDILNAFISSYIPRSNKLALEQAIWANTKISWKAYVSNITTEFHPAGGHFGKTYKNFPAPTPPSSRINISGNEYITLSQYDDLSYVVGPITDGEEITTTTYKVSALILLPIGSSPISLLSIGGFGIGSTVNFDLTFAERTQYTIRNSISAPAAGSDGQRYIDLDTLVGLVPGDPLTIPLVDSSSGKNRRTALSVTVEDLDGEQCRAWLVAPINQVIPAGSNAVLANTDPVFSDAARLCAQLAAPFPVDVSQLGAFGTASPVLTWLAADKVNSSASPQLYAAHNVDVIRPARNGTESIQYSSRGALTPGTYTSPVAGNWTGNETDGYTWNGGQSSITLTSPAYLPLAILAPVTQFPGADVGTFYLPPVMYVEGDLSSGATIPVNGWLQNWRTYGRFDRQDQDYSSYWDGATVFWAFQSSAGQIPVTLVFFTSQCVYAARNTYVGGVLTVEPLASNGTWGTPFTGTLTGAAVSGGHWMSFAPWPFTTRSAGPTVYADQEGVCGLYLTGSGSSSFTKAQLASFSYAAGTMTCVNLTTIEVTPTATGVWSCAGGLAIKCTTVTINGVDYPLSKIYKYNAKDNTVYEQTLYGLEILKNTVCMRSIQSIPQAVTVGDPFDHSNQVSGHLMLALETYLDSSNVINRRLRLLWVDRQLNVLNGESVPSIFDPTFLVRLGDIVVDPVPDGQALVARMVRANDTNQSDKCYGIFGGRRFMVDFSYSLVVERLNLSANLTITALEAIQGVMVSLLANAIPKPDGSLSLVSRQLGTKHVRVSGGLSGSFFSTEITSYKSKPTGNNFYNTVNITYTNDITGSSENVTVTGYGIGGNSADIDMTLTNSGATLSRAVGIAYNQNFGQIPSVVNAILREDVIGSATSSANEPYWASWNVGDKILPVPAASGSLVQWWKLLDITRDDEKRTAKIQIEQLPILEVL